MSTRVVMKRVIALGLPYLPIAIGVVVISSLYSLATSALLWFLGNTIFSTKIPMNEIPAWLQARLAGMANSHMPLSQVVLWGGLGALVVGLSAYLKGVWSGLLVWQVMRDLRQKLCDHLLEMDLGFFQGRKTGDLISRVNNDVAYTQSAVTFVFQDMLQNPASILMGLLFLLRMDWKLTLACLGILLVVVVPMRHFSKKIRKAGQEGAESLGDITQATHQMLGGMRIVKAFRAEAREREGFAAVNYRFFRRMMSIVRARAASGAFVELATYGLLATGGGVLLTWLVRNGHVAPIRPERLGIFLLIGVQRIFAPIRNLSKSLGTMYSNLPGAVRVFEVLDTVPAVREKPLAVALAPIAREILFEGITFSYDAVDVLKDVTVRIPKGSLVAFVGPSGAGKSTVLSLLPRFYDPQAGRITIDGTDLREVTRDSLLGQMAVVNQDPFLFHATIGENISYGRPSASRADVEAAARAANLHEIIQAMPKGYDTVVGDRGLRLSGGERQRVAIARAILRDAAILILDEATSSLDSASERAVQEALDRLMEGRTTLVIAHRLSTVLHADRIVVLDAGRVVAQGTHDELMAQDGLYRKLCEMQFAPAREALG